MTISPETLKSVRDDLAKVLKFHRDKTKNEFPYGLCRELTTLQKQEYYRQCDLIDRVAITVIEFDKIFPAKKGLTVTELNDAKAFADFVNAFNQEQFDFFMHKLAVLNTMRMIHYVDSVKGN